MQTNSAPLEDFGWWARINSRLSYGETLPRETIKEAVQKWLTYLDDPNYLAPTVGFWAAFSIKGNWKGYTEDEIAGVNDGVEAMKAFHYQLKRDKPIVDISGGGGDTLKTFNISSAASMVAAAAGAISPKPAGKAVTSRTGAADLAVALGFNISAPPEVVSECINEYGFAYQESASQYPFSDAFFRLMGSPFAPTIAIFFTPFRMGILGINPFDVKRMVRGVSNPQTEIVAKSLAKMGCERVLVPCGFGPTSNMMFDEFSVVGKTMVSEIRQGQIKTYEMTPEEVGLKTYPPDEIVQGQTHEENARYLMGVISGRDKGGKRDVVLLNAAAVLYLAEIVEDLRAGVQLAAKTIDEGRVIALLEKVLLKTGGNLDKFKSYIL